MSLLLLLNTGAPPFPIAFRLDVDWDNDGDYLDANEDVTNDASMIETRRGRDYASQWTAQSVAGRLRATLINVDGKYSPDNASSPLFGKVLPGRRVRLRAPTAGAPVGGNVVLWTGYLDRIEPTSAPGRISTVELTASGPLITLANRKALYEPLQNRTTGYIINRLLNKPDAVILTQFPLIDTGQTTVPRWGIPEKTTLDAIRELERTELGFFSENPSDDPDQQFVFEDRHHRLKNDHLTARATWADTGAGGTIPFVDIRQRPWLDTIVNSVTVTVRGYTVDAPAVLWTHAGGPITIGPGQQVTVLATYPNSQAGATDGAWVDPWILPVAGTDFTVSGVAQSDIEVMILDLGMGRQATATSMIIRLRNNHAARTATISNLQARGTAVRRVAETRIVQEDTTSQNLYGIRAFDLPGPWIPDTATAEGYARYIVRRMKDPHPVLSITFRGSASATIQNECLTRQLSDRVTVNATGQSRLGVNADMFVESVAFRIRRDIWETTFDVSPADTETYWVLGVSRLGVDTRPAF